MLYEVITNIVPIADAKGDTLAVLHNKAGDMGVAVGYNVKQLPVLTVWKNTDTKKQGYVTGLEPGTSYAYNTKYQRPLGLVPKIQPGETKTFDLTVITSYSIHYTKLYESLPGYQGELQPALAGHLPAGRVGLLCVPGRRGGRDLPPEWSGESLV